MNFASNLRYLRKKSGKTQGVLSSELNLGRTTIANYEAKICEPNMETLVAFSVHFGVPIDMLISADLLKEGFEPGKKDGSNGNAIRVYHSIPRVLTVDNQGNDNIVYVPVKARAGYLNGYGDTEFIETLPTFRLPGMSNATYRMFEVDGPSMAPNVLHGDRVIGEWVGDINQVRDNRVHIVVHSGGVAIKRIINRLAERGKFYLKSDTIAHRHEFPTIEMDPAEIKELWYAKLKISSDFTEPAEIYTRLADLEADVVEMKMKLK